MSMSRKYLAAAVGMALAAIARAETIEVKVEGVKFVPSIVYAAVGDILSFHYMPTHFVESMQGMWPEGAPRMLSAMGQPYQYRIEQPGLYVYKCPPHWSAHMGGIVVVGPPANLNGAIDRYFSVAEASREAKPAKILLYRLKENLDPH